MNELARGEALYKRMCVMSAGGIKQRCANCEQGEVACKIS